MGFFLRSRFRRAEQPDACLRLVGVGLIMMFSAACGSGGTTEPQDDDAAPSVAIQAPSDGESSVEGSEVTLSATAVDREDGDLTSSIEWSSTVDGALGTGGTLSLTLSVGAHELLASVTDSRDQTTTAEVSYEITEDQEPSLTIDEPLDGSQVVQVYNVELTGTAFDPEDGDLTSSIAWTSDIDGALGTGGALDAELSAGAHTITATVSDSRTQTATESVAVEVLIPSAYVTTFGGTSTLYRVEMSVVGTDTNIGLVQTPEGASIVITDIALSSTGALYAVSYDALYSLDSESATVTRIGGLGRTDVVGLAFDANGTLFGSTQSGHLITIDTATGVSAVVGPFGSSLTADGDLAFSDAGELWGSMLQGGVSVLTTIDPVTGVANVVGPSGRPLIWGLVWDGPRLFGFATDNASSHEIVLIDPATGAASEVRAIQLIPGGAGAGARTSRNSPKSRDRD